MSEKLRNMTSIYLSRGNKMLLLYRRGGRVVNNAWVGSAGGHFEKKELNDAEACILRELYEELGISANQISDLTLKYITLRRTKNEIRQNYYFFARLDGAVPEEITSNEGDCRWFDYSEIPALEMPFTAKYVIEHYLREGMSNDKMYGGIANRENVLFTELPRT